MIALHSVPFALQKDEQALGSRASNAQERVGKDSQKIW